VSTTDELGRFIRFQLAELGARNGHHEFEHITRNFARLRISERIIPATGPVGAGGDAGRDFETYRSYLANTPIAGSTFLARVPDKTLVFACSLMKGIESKIRTDVRTICGGSQRVDEVYYFCEQNIAVGRRNKLIQNCRDKYGVILTILDGQALAENLVAIDVHWIAQQYLGVPAELYPKALEADETYDSRRRAWITEARTPGSFADFLDVKAGLRQAIFNKERRADLLSWINVMSTLCEGDSVALRRRAIYEICVAALRGLDDLSARAELVKEYFSTIEGLRDVVDLRDATVLLTYCSAASAMDHFDMEGEVIHRYTVALVRNLDSRLREGPLVGQQCLLLQIRGMAELLQFRRSAEPHFDVGGIFGFWNRMLRLVPNSPLFPLESFADALTALTPRLGADARFEALAQKTDELLERRTSGRISAEKSRDRAVAFLKEDRILLAMRQLHIAKIKWFSAETLRGSILSILLLSQSYLRLGLVYAAKYYSAAAVYLAHSASDDDVKYLVAAAIREHFDACFSGGEWFTCAGLAKWVFASHNVYDKDAYNLERHEELMRVFYHLAVIEVLAGHSPAVFAKHMEHLRQSWPVTEDVRRSFEALLEDACKSWPDTDLVAQKKRAESDLWGRPFLDLGRERAVVWRALGIHWTAQFINDRETVALCEELLAALQVTLADLATTDLVLLPTGVQLELYLTPQDEFVEEEVHGNDIAKWRIGLPRIWLQRDRDNSTVVSSVVALASGILGKCSTLSIDEFRSRLTGAFKSGLLQKVMVVRPYTQLYLELVQADDFEREFRVRFDPLFGGQEFEVREAGELAWPITDAPGYSKKQSEEFISNRYRRTMAPIRYTLPRLVRDPVVGQKLVALREQGLKDWEILLIVANRATSYRVEKREVASLKALGELTHEMMNAEEDPSLPPIPADEFSDDLIDTQRPFTTAAIAKTWGVHLHRQTPDFKALRRLLEIRYHITRDDVTHDDILAA
jgi:hypothetical protein